jgi:hypothetical protein
MFEEYENISLLKGYPLFPLSSLLFGFLFWIRSFRDILPHTWTFTINPVSRDRVPLKIAILVSIASFQQLQQRVPKRRIHANSVPRRIASDIMPGKTFLEKSFLVRTPAVKFPIRRTARGVLPPFPPRIVPGT